jgi:hypothetical protein
MNKLFYLSMMSALILVSCTDEQEVNPSITLGTLTVEVVTNGAMKDDYLQTARFIVFDKASSSPKIDINQVIQFKDQEKDAKKFRTQLEVSCGKDKMMVVIINEPQEMTSQLENISTLAELGDLDFQMADVFNRNHTTLKDSGLLMTGTVRGISVKPENTEANPAQASVTVYRSVARVELWLKADSGVDAFVDGSTSVTLSKTYGEGFLMRPEPYYNFGKLQTVIPNKTVNWTFTGSTPQEININAQLICSFYTPERTCTAPNDSDKLVLDIEQVSADGKRRDTQATLSGFSTGGGIQQTITRIERNNVYRITGRLKNNNIEFEHNILPWEELEESAIIDPQYFLRVNKDLINLPDAIQKPVSIVAKTNYDRTDRGYDPGIVIGKTYYYNSSDIEEKDGNLFGWLDVKPLNTAGSLTCEVEFKAIEDLSTTPRGCYAKVEIKAGNAVKRVKINR